MCVLTGCHWLPLSVLLRQNPHNVHEWLKRVKLYEGKPRDVSVVGVMCGVCVSDVLTYVFLCDKISR